MHVKPSVLLGAFLLCASTVAAQQGPPPACTSPEFHQFDFWAGSWNVTDSAGGTPYGTNDVTLEESGCVVHEHWTGSRGGTGQSFNHWDRERKVWEQYWVASDGTDLHLVGHLEGNAMRLEADIAGPNGTTTHQRITWISEPDGRVRQFWQTSTDGGRTWTVAFDGWYRKKV